MDLSLVLLTGLLLCSLCWLYLYFQRMDIRVELSEALKYLFLSIGTDVSFFLGSVLEKLGICSQIKFLRATLMFGLIRGDRELYIRDEQFDNVPVRIYEPKHPFSHPRRCIIYIHGGVALIGTIRAYAKLCRTLSLKTGTMVVDIGYRLGPEHPHPAQFEDCMSAVLHFLKEAENYGVDPNRIILAGDSSGGTLVSLVCRHLVTRRDIPRIRAQVLFYPAIQAVNVILPSYQQNSFAPVLCGRRAFQLATRFVTEEPIHVNGFLKNAHVPDDLSVKYRKWVSADHIPDEFKVRGYVPITPAPFSEKLYQVSGLLFRADLCPLLFEDDVIRQLPETFLLTCEYDILRDDGLLYKKRLEDNSVPVTWLHLKKGFHGIMFRHNFLPFQIKAAENAWKHVVDFIQRC